MEVISPKISSSSFLLPSLHSKNGTRRHPLHRPRSMEGQGRTSFSHPSSSSSRYPWAMPPTMSTMLIDYGRSGLLPLSVALRSPSLLPTSTTSTTRSPSSLPSSPTARSLLGMAPMASSSSRAPRSLAMVSFGSDYRAILSDLGEGRRMLDFSSRIDGGGRVLQGGIIVDRYRTVWLAACRSSDRAGLQSNSSY